MELDFASVDSQVLIDGGEKVVCADSAIDDVFTPLIGGADQLSGRYASSGEQH